MVGPVKQNTISAPIAYAVEPRPGSGLRPELTIDNPRIWTIASILVFIFPHKGSVHYFVHFLQFEQRLDLFWPTHPPSNSNIEDK